MASTGATAKFSSIPGCFPFGLLDMSSLLGWFTEFQALWAGQNPRTFGTFRISAGADPSLSYCTFFRNTLQSSMTWSFAACCGSDKLLPQQSLAQPKPFSDRARNQSPACFYESLLFWDGQFEEMNVAVLHLL